uniref:hypothetical protein 22 n=1 Tax=Moniliophthora perniciosa TaxID=153609 RepID=UPI0000242359|nr:hypothetical protein 22 [Moniliophthora perniciosa]AAQ74312.1 hypothetical protein 22 [Moniliophthora perniciosa]
MRYAKSANALSSSYQREGLLPLLPASPCSAAEGKRFASRRSKHPPLLLLRLPFPCSYLIRTSPFLFFLLFLLRCLRSMQEGAGSKGKRRHN